jgi:uncharacterized ferritin-like protein (DUF455 family)
MLPVHTSLWEAVADDITLLDRIVTVHRHLEGSGLDSGVSILNRLVGSHFKGMPTIEIVKMIVTEEVDHVLFGSRWFKMVCDDLKLDADQEFRRQIYAISKKVPRRDRPALDHRRRAGFNEAELQMLIEINEAQVYQRQHRPPS